MLYLEDLIELDGELNYSKYNLTPQQIADFKQLMKNKKLKKQDFGKLLQVTKRGKDGK